MMATNSYNTSECIYSKGNRATLNNLDIFTSHRDTNKENLPHTKSLDQSVTLHVHAAIQSKSTQNRVIIQQDYLSEELFFNMVMNGKLDRGIKRKYSEVGCP